MAVLYVLIEMSSRSIESAASAAVALVGDGGAGGFNAALFHSSELGAFLEAASDVGDTAFVLGAAWYMLRFFRSVPCMLVTSRSEQRLLPPPFVNLGFLEAARAFSCDGSVDRPRCCRLARATGSCQRTVRSGPPRSPLVAG